MLLVASIYYVVIALFSTLEQTLVSLDAWDSKWVTTFFGIYVALRPRRRDDLLGTGTEWERGQGDWLDRGNRPKKTGETVDRRQNNGSVKAVSPRHCPATCALPNCFSTAVPGQSHRDNVRCNADEEQLEAKEVQLSQPSSTSLLMISSGLTWKSSSTSLL